MVYDSTWEDFESIAIFGTAAAFLTIIGTSVARICGIVSVAVFVNVEGVQSIEFLW